jgi:hypothetical protein
MEHIELLVVNKEYVLLEEAFATLTAALHVIIELEYVVVHKKLISLLYRATISSASLFEKRWSSSEVDIIRSIPPISLVLLYLFPEIGLVIKYCGDCIKS